MAKTIFCGILSAFLVLASCSPTYNTTNEFITESDAGDGDTMSNLTRSFLSVMTTSQNRLGSFAGDKVPSLQIDDLVPGEYTLEFQVVEPPVDPEDFALYAYISWKVDGQQIERIINVFSGAVISGVAGAVDVKLQDQSGRGTVTNFLPNASVVHGSAIITFAAPVTLSQGQIIIFPPSLSTPFQQTYTVALGVTNSVTVQITQAYAGGTSGLVNSFSIATYKVAAALSKGTRPTIMQPPTLLTQTIALILVAGAPQSIPIPQDAGVISVLVTVIAGAGPQTESLNGWVDFLDKAGSLVLGNFVPNYFSGWFPVPVGAFTMRLHNESTTATLSYGIQWGIEG
ncbi:Uncharacterised protein [uncultured archaeon]|nr:Uncharacterised protein [uncultured archaeon]